MPDAASVLMQILVMRHSDGWPNGLVDMSHDRKLMDVLDGFPDECHCVPPLPRKWHVLIVYFCPFMWL